MDQGTGMLPDLYRAGQIYGWSAGMSDVTCALLEQVSLPAGPILELGCGSGRLLRILHSRFSSRTVIGVDLHRLALGYAGDIAHRPPALLQAHLQRLPFAAGLFAMVVAMDTMDQRGVNLLGALYESWRILRPGGILLLRVSAHAWLQGPHDAAFNTGKRYDKRSLTQALATVQFDLQRITYANMLLSAPTGCLRLLQRWRVVPLMPALYTSISLNQALEIALGYEARWLRGRDLPVGLSLFAIASKPGP